MTFLGVFSTNEVTELLTTYILFFKLREQLKTEI
jgi:hypothetical protein